MGQREREADPLQHELSPAGGRGLPNLTSKGCSSPRRQLRFSFWVSRHRLVMSVWSNTIFNLAVIINLNMGFANPNQVLQYLLYKRLVASYFCTGQGGIRVK